MSRDFSTVEPGTIATSSLRASVSAAERRHQFADERILSIVREGESGQRVADLCEAHGISAQMYYLWKARYGGMDLTDLQRLRRRAVTVRSAVIASTAAVAFIGGIAIGRMLPPIGPGHAQSMTPTALAAAPPAPPVVAAAPAPPQATEAAPAATPETDPLHEKSVEAKSPPVSLGEEGPPVARTLDEILTDGRPERAGPPAGSDDSDRKGREGTTPAPDRAPSDGFSVQVAAVPDVREADALIGRLTAKGYSAFVSSKAGPQPLHRVRVGPFKTREEAQAAADRLSVEDQFKPWITR